MEETKTETTFARGRHLAFAIVGLAHAPLTQVTAPVVLAWVGEWSAAASTINSLLYLCFASFVAWLAFAVFDTGADVSLGPRRWRELGPLFALWCVGIEIHVVYSVWQDPERSLEIANHAAAFALSGELRVGWLAFSVLVAAAAEEIVYRALLQRALEGYIGTTWAIVTQAAVFELVHIHVYGYGKVLGVWFTGLWFFGGYLLGYAFARTRSLAVPTLLHAGHNFLLFTLVWYFNQ